MSSKTENEFCPTPSESESSEFRCSTEEMQRNSSESAPEDVKSKDSLPEDVKSTEFTPDDMQSSEALPEDVKSPESGSEDVNSVYSVPGVVQSSESTPDDVPPTVSTPEDVKPSSSTSEDVKSKNSLSDDVKLTDAIREDVHYPESSPDNVKSVQPISEDVILPESTPEDVTATEFTSDVVHPVDSTPDDVKLADSILEDVRSKDSLPEDVKSMQSASEDVKPVDTIRGDVHYPESSPEDVKSKDSLPEDVPPTKSHPEDVTLPESTPEDVTLLESTPEDVSPSISTSEATELSLCSPDDVPSSESDADDVTSSEFYYSNEQILILRGFPASAKFMRKMENRRKKFEETLNESRRRKRTPFNYWKPRLLNSEVQNPLEIFEVERHRDVLEAHPTTSSLLTNDSEVRRRQDDKMSSPLRRLLNMNPSEKYESSDDSETETPTSSESLTSPKHPFSHLNPTSSEARLRHSQSRDSGIFDGPHQRNSEYRRWGFYSNRMTSHDFPPLNVRSFGNSEFSEDVQNQYGNPDCGEESNAPIDPNPYHFSNSDQYPIAQVPRGSQYYQQNATVPNQNPMIQQPFYGLTPNQSFRISHTPIKTAPWNPATNDYDYE